MKLGIVYIIDNDTCIVFLRIIFAVFLFALVFVFAPCIIESQLHWEC